MKISSRMEEKYVSYFGSVRDQKLTQTYSREMIWKIRHMKFSFSDMLEIIKNNFLIFHNNETLLGTSSFD